MRVWNLMGIPFDQHTNLLGVPGRSNAFDISKRLQAPSIIIDQTRVDFIEEDQDAMISDLEQKRRRAA